MAGVSPTTASEAPRQRLEDLKAEIGFRAKLARQHVTGEMLLPDYPGKEEHDQILRERIEATRRDMAELRSRDVALSPFLELGAERGQRSLVLVNEFGAAGVATDISFHQLQTMEHFGNLFGLPRLPLRVCCDANRLPFQSGAFRFAFCYQFLHHFPALPPVIGEIRRVTAGHFLFAEEPYPRRLRLALYRQRSSVWSAESRAKNRYLRLLESFVSTERRDEDEHGVLENDDISLGEWRRAVDAFAGCEIELESIYNVRSRLNQRFGPANVLNWLLGGTVRGLCRVDGPASSTAAAGRSGPADLTQILVCPDCVIDGDEGDDRAPLEAAGDGFRCARCEARYPSRDGVLFLLPPSELRELYPDVAET
jgi:SAM-dependent methyltransferase